jgi:hypothetical protein
MTSVKGCAFGAAPCGEPVAHRHGSFRLRGFAPTGCWCGVAARQTKRLPNGEPQAHRKVLRQRRIEMLPTFAIYC